MEQLTYIKERLQVSSFPVLSLHSFSLGSYELIALATVVSLLATLSSGSPFPIYLLNGLVLPLLFAHHGTPLTNYWEWFCVLLLLRRLTGVLLALDVLFPRFRR